MKRFIAAALAVCMLTSGCTLHTEPETQQGATLAVSLSNSYRSELFESNTFGNSRMLPCGDKILLYGGDAPCFGLFDPTTDTVLQGDKLDDFSEIKGAALSDGKLELFVQTWTDGVYTASLLTYDEQLHLLDTKDMSGIWNGYIYSWRKDIAGNMYISDEESIWVCRSGETPQQLPETVGGQNFCMGRDGTVVCVPTSRGKPSRIDISTMTTVSVELDGLPQNGYNNGGYFDGTTEYDFLCCDETALYGVQIAEGVIKELVNWNSSDFADCSDCVALPDGRFMVSAFDYMSLTFEKWLLTARTQEEVDNLELLSVASCYFSQETESMIGRFNRQAEDFRLVLKRYYNEKDYQGGIDQLTADLLAGIIPDILLLPELDYQALSNKGLFEDMRPWMEKDPDFHSEDYMMNFLESMTYKGRMERIAFRFLSEGYMAKTEFLNSHTSLTAQDILSLDLPEGMCFLDATRGRDVTFDMVCNTQLGGFVDYANAECSFDSPEFISLMELIGTVPNERTVSDDYGYQENRILLYGLNLSDLTTYHFAKEVVFDGEDVTLTGLVCGEGNGGIIYPFDTLAVSAVSAHKEEAWAFIKFYMQAENSSSYGFSVNRAALEQSMAKEIQRDTEHSKWSCEMDGVDVEVSAATQAEADELMAYLEGISVCTFNDSKVIAIVREEAGKYFAGDQTVETCASSIQNRVNIYLSEQI